MDVYQFIRRAVGSAIPLLLIAIFIISCGSSSTTGSTATTSTTAAATACTSTIKVVTTNGTVQSVSSTGMTVTGSTGATMPVTLASTTHVRQLTTEKVSSLQEGTYVSVVTTQNADSTYSATIVLSLGNISSFAGVGGTGGTRTGGGFGTRKAGNAACRARRQGAGFAGASGSSGLGGITGTTVAGLSGKNVITGKISQVNSSVLVVNDVKSGGNFSITLTNSTQIYTYSTATTAALKSGQHVSVSGKKNSQGGIDASAVTILAGNLTA